MKQKSMIVHGVILGIFCLGFALLLAVIDLLTAKDISARALEDRLNSLSQVIPDAIHDNNLVTDAILMKNEQGNEITVYRATKEGKVTGVAYEIFGSGYAGKIKLMLGVDAEGKVLGVRVLAHKETPGLGDKIETKKGDWILRFTGLSIGKQLWAMFNDEGSLASPIAKVA